MFDADAKSLAATLTQMERQALECSNYNRVEAKERMAQWIKQDRRFDAFDPTRLVERVQHCRSAGAVFDCDDPQLRKGGQARPPERRGRY
jgi:hypothetical protein